VLSGDWKEIKDTYSIEMLLFFLTGIQGKRKNRSFKAYDIK